MRLKSRSPGPPPSGAERDIDVARKARIADPTVGRARRPHRVRRPGPRQRRRRHGHHAAVRAQLLSRRSASPRRPMPTWRVPKPTACARTRTPNAARAIDSYAADARRVVALAATAAAPMSSAGRTCWNACGAKASCRRPTTCCSSSKPWTPHWPAPNSKHACGAPTPTTSPPPASSNAGPDWRAPHENAHDDSIRLLTLRLSPLAMRASRLPRCSRKPKQPEAAATTEAGEEHTKAAKPRKRVAMDDAALKAAGIQPSDLAADVAQRRTARAGRSGRQRLRHDADHAAGRSRSSCAATPSSATKCAPARRW